MHLNFFVSLAFILAVSVQAGEKSRHDNEPRASSPSGWEALSSLKTGNMRFYEGRALHSNQDPSRRYLVAGSQHPQAIVVSCSDSRLAPEIIFDQGLGEIFSVRLAGNLMSSEAIASIEHAVDHLGVKLLLVMGHESCEFVGAALAARPGKSNGSESLDLLMKQIRENLSSEAVSSSAQDKKFRLAVKDNVRASLRSLLQRSEIVRNAVAKGDLVLGKAIYSLDSGQVEFSDVGQVLNLTGPIEKMGIQDEKVQEQMIPSDFRGDQLKAKSKDKSRLPASVH